MAGITQVDKWDHSQLGEASLLQNTWKFSILHIRGSFQTVNSLQAKAILQEYPEPMPYGKGIKRTPKSLALQSARTRDFGKSRWVVGLEESWTECTR